MLLFVNVYLYKIIYTIFFRIQYYFTMSSLLANGLTKMLMYIYTTKPMR